MRPFIAADAIRMLALVSDALCGDLSIEPIHTLAQAQAFVMGKGSSHRDRYAVLHPLYGLIGGVAWGKQTANVAFISYWIFPPYQGQGLGKQALSLLLNHITKQGIPDIIADVYYDNLVSKKLLKHFGFVWSGRQLDDLPGKAIDRYELRL
ncbi:GNAT family N-acetyltransferase [Marinomonas sp. TW1]|uniref:GNAT family N-acetyltransferase n=1 Tax=Marinomonas sp. TW1 TaxID=1561203 RepID=UPI0022B23A46|nr:GNAT family N-acetyltransferase [Marinomonas sp. TW1]